jgi:hypothetical protein
MLCGARSSVVGWSTMLQAWSLRVPVSMKSFDFFNLSNPSRRTMALGLTQPLTETGTRNFLGGKGRSARKADNLTIIYEPTVYIMWDPRRPTTPRASTACYRDSFTFFSCILCIFQEAHLSRDSVVGIATSYGLGDHENFLFFTSSRPALRSTQPPIQRVLGDFPQW